MDRIIGQNEANTQIDAISDQGTCLRSRWSSNKTVSRKYGAESLKVNRPLLCLLAPSCRSTNYSQCSDRLPHFLPYLHPYSSVLSVFSPLLPFICALIHYLPHKSGWTQPKPQMKSDVRSWRMASLVHGTRAARLRRFTPWPIHSPRLLSEMYLSLAAAIEGRQIKREKQRCLVLYRCKPAVLFLIQPLH